MEAGTAQHHRLTQETSECQITKPVENRDKHQEEPQRTEPKPDLMRSRTPCAPTSPSRTWRIAPPENPPQPPLNPTRNHSGRPPQDNLEAACSSLAKATKETVPTPPGPEGEANGVPHPTQNGQPSRRRKKDKGNTVNPWPPNTFPHSGAHLPNPRKEKSKRTKETIPIP